MTQAAPFLDRLAAAADQAAAAETECRRDTAERIKRLAQERAFAFRRLNLMRGIAAAVAGAKSEEVAVAGALATLRSRLGWAADDEAHAVILSRFNPVAQAVFASLQCDGETSPPDVAAALAEFEGWYAGMYPAPFWDLFERYMAETPVVDF